MQWCGAAKFSEMRHALREWVCYLLGVWVLVGFSTLPDSALCVRPGNHVAIEAIDDLCCAVHSAGSPGFGIEVPDDCIDVPLNLQILRAEGTALPHPRAAFGLQPAQIHILAQSRIAVCESARLRSVEFRSRAVILQC